MRLTEQMAIATPAKTIDLMFDELERIATEYRHDQYCSQWADEAQAKASELKVFLKERFSEESEIKGLADLEERLEQTIKELRALIENLPEDGYFGESEREYYVDLAKRCRYLIEVRKMQQQRQELLDEMISGNKISGTGLYKLIRRYSRELGETVKANPIDRWVIQENGNPKESYPRRELWLRELYGPQQRYLEDALEDLNYLSEGNEVEESQEPSELPVENQIREIERIIKTEVGVQVAIAQLVEQFPEHEGFIRRRMRKVLDAYRERQQ